MSETRLSPAERIFSDAAELDRGERAAFLDEECAGDAVLREQVDALLAAFEASDAYFDSLPGRLGIDRLRSGKAGECRAEAGQVFGQYRLTRLLGTGGMGTVWLAERADGRFEGRVAVKLLTRAGSAAALERFDREAHYLAKLTHPNIARLIDAGVGPGGVPFLIIEHVDGLPIDAWCDARAVDVPERLRLFLRVAEAVAHAHSRLIVHSDIKPSNVLVDDDGEVKLLDFGIATLLEGDSRSGGADALTPEYAAPEQLAGDGVTTASDVYALGLLLFLLLTGQHARPLPASASLEDLRRAALAAPPSLTDTVDGERHPRAGEAAAARGVSPARLLHVFRGDLDAIVQKSLAVDPAERYAGVNEFAADLRRYLGREPVSAIPDSLPYRSRKFIARHRGGVLSAVLTAMVLVGAAALTTWQSIEARKQRDAALFQKQRVMASNQFLNLVLSEIGPAGTPLTLVQLLDRGVTLIDRQYPLDDPFVAYTLYDVSVLYATIGQLDRQLELLDRAEAVVRGRDDPSLLATVLCAKSRALHIEDPPAAAAYLDGGLAALPGGAAALSTNLQCARAQGLALATAGRHEEAAVVFGSALNSIDASPVESFNRINLLNDLTEQYLLSGRYDDALSSMDEVIAESERMGRGNTASHIVFLANKGAVLSRVGEVLAAAEIRRSAYERIKGMDEPVVGVGLHYGGSLVDLARFDEAIAVLQAELRVADRAGNTRISAQTALNIGMAQVRSGNAGAGEAYLQRAEAFFRDSPEANARLLAILESTRAEASLGTGNTAGARSAVANALLRLDYPATKSAVGIFLPLWVAARVELAAGETEPALQFVADALVAAQAAARDPSRSADVGKALLVRAQVRRARVPSKDAVDDLGAAATALQNGLGAEHPLTIEARRLLAVSDSTRAAHQ